MNGMEIIKFVFFITSVKMQKRCFSDCVGHISSFAVWWVLRFCVLKCCI